MKDQVVGFVSAVCRDDIKKRPAVHIHEAENSEKRYWKAKSEFCFLRWMKADCVGIRSGLRLK
jgi:hypothetical protein